VNARRKYRRYCEIVAASDETEHESAEVDNEEEADGRQDGAVETSTEPCVNRTAVGRRRYKKRKSHRRRLDHHETDNTDDTEVADSDSKESAEQAVVCPYKPKNSTDVTENPLCVARSTTKRPPRRRGYYSRRCRKRGHERKRWRKRCHKKKSKKHKHRQPVEFDEDGDDGNDADEEEEVATTTLQPNENLSDENIIK
jgi:hypothetical protein